MKKALVLLLTLSMVFSVFAAEPVANVNVSEFKGEASVTWGIDLDTEKTGFSNSAKATLKLNLLDSGDAATTGEGVWGEIKIKTDKDTFMKAEGQGAVIGALPTQVKVDSAKLHLGENAYVGIMSGDTLVGEYKLITAVKAEQIKNVNTGALIITDLEKMTGSSYSEGIVAGYGNDLFSVDVDFRSYKDGDNQYTNAYSFAADAALKAVDNLTLKAGYSKDFANKYDESITDAFYVASDYKLGLNDTFYLKPQVGYEQAITSITEDDAKQSVTVGNLVAAVLLGWGDTKDANAGVYFLDDDAAKKVTPGISVAMSMPLVNKASAEYEGETGTITTKLPSALSVSFFSGEIVENLTAAALYETKVGATQTIEKLGDVEEKSEAVKPEGYDFAAGLKYKLAAGDGSITPQFGVKIHDEKVEANDSLNIKVGAEFAGYVENTTFSVVYASNNLKAKENTKGTLNFTCKIAF